MGRLCSKLCRTAGGQGDGADNARVSKQKTSTSYSPHNDTSDQRSKNHSTPTETTVASSNISIPVAHDVLNTPVHPDDAVADHKFSEAQPSDTQTLNVSTSWGVTPDQPCKHPLTPIESSMAASDTFTTPTANQPAIRTTCIPDIVTSSTISESQLYEAQTKKASPLWEEAFRKMQEQTEGRLGDDEMPPKGSLVDNIIKDLKERKEQCDDKRWFIIKDDRKVFIVDTLLVQLDKYAAIGDIALQHNPDIVALVWAGFRGLLQVGTAYIKMMRSVSESLDYLVQLLCCCDIYEKLYCDTKLDISEDLKGSFVDLYVSVLKYLRKTSIYLDHDTGGRIIRSFSQEIEHALSGIKSQQIDLKEKIDVAEKEASTSNRFNQDKNMTRLRRLLAGIQEPIKETLRVVEIIYNKVENDRRHQILTWLSDVEYESHHLLSQQRRLKGTGSWLLENKPYIEWTTSEANSILWLRADAGFGKTILASSIVDNFASELGSSNDHVLAYFYCNYKEPTRRSTESILRALVKQFCVHGEGDDRVPTLVDDIYKEREKKGSARGSLSSEESTELIIKLSEKYQSTTIIVDALDECDAQTRRTLFSSLHRITEKATQVKFLVTSRFDDDINEFFSQGPYHYIDARDNSADIHLYIDTELDLRCNKSNVHCEYELLLGGNVEPGLRADIESTLKSKSNGMFMWANLQIKALCAARTVGSVQKTLARMPATLSETYLQIMERIKKQNNESYRVAKIILKWLLCAQEDCKTQSVIQALAVDPGDSTLNEDGLTWTIPMILGLCKNLVIHDTTLDIFRFAHFSVQEFLRLQTEFEEKSSNSYVAEVCLTTLLYHHASNCPSESPVQQLYTYATTYWGAHVCLSEAMSGRVEDLCMRLLTPSAPYKAWGTTIAVSNSNFESPGGEVVCPFWVACYYELQYLPKLLCRVSNKDINLRNAGGCTPLDWAAAEGNVNTVQLLLQKEGVEVDSKDDEGQTPLSRAASNGHEKVVQLLLEKEGVDVDSKDNQGRTPLSWAASNGHEKVVQLLLEKEGVEVDSKDDEGRTPLSRAAYNDHEKVVQLLLEKEGVEVDSRDDNGRTPLSRAAYNGHEKVVQLLLEKEGVDVDSKDNQGQTPLSWAAVWGNEKVVQLLLEKEGVEVDSKDDEGQTPLSRAACNGHEKVVQLLLEKEGVDVDSKDNQSRTPLSWAAEWGHEKVVQLLLEKEGVDVDSKDNQGRTPLSWVATNDHEKVVQLLLEKEGVDVDSKDNQGWTPLSKAARFGYEKVVQLLLEKEGVDVDSKDNQGWTPLSWAVSWGYEKVVQLLLEKEGVDVGFKDNEGRTPLSLAAERGNEMMVQLLLQKEGVDADSKDDEGRTPLSRAAYSGCEKVVQLLLEKEGVDVGSKDNEGRTLLFWAAEGGNEMMVQLLLQKEGVDADSKDNEGRTLLSWAAEKRRKEVVQLLLKKEGVDAGSKDLSGRTPLSWAAQGNLLCGPGCESCLVDYKCVVEILLEQEGVEVDSKDMDGRTPLSRAAGEGHRSLVQLLLQKEGVDVNYKDNEGRTPLSRAAENGHAKVVQLLLEEEGVDVDSKDNTGRTPFDIARAYDRLAVTMLLEKKRAELAIVSDPVQSLQVEPITAHQ